ncbi:unnamed protein product, partial [Symbiodinium sp. KB8]
MTTSTMTMAMTIGDDGNDNDDEADHSAFTCLLPTQSMVWRSVRKFCQDEYPGMVFRNYAARKAFVIRQGLKLQADDAGIEGVVTAKDSDDVKELKVGKRIAASKIRAQHLEDAADMSREQINQMHAKNAAQLAVEVNDEDEVAATKAGQSMDDDPTQKGERQAEDDDESSSSQFGLAAPKARVRTKTKQSKPSSESGLKGSSKKLPTGSPLKPMAAVKALDPSLIWKGAVKDPEIQARFKKAADLSSALEKEAVSLEEGSETAQAVRTALNEATEAVNNAQIVYDVLGKLRGIKQVQDAEFAAELTKALQAPAMDADTLAAIRSYLGSKVAAETGFGCARSVVFGGPRWLLRMVSVGDPTQVQKPEEGEGSEEFDCCSGPPEQCRIENIKTLEQLDEAIVHFPPPIGLQPDFGNTAGLYIQVFTDWQRLLSAIYIRDSDKQGSAVPNGVKLFMKEANGALEGQTLVSQAKGVQDEAVIVVNEKRGACSLNLRGLLSDVKRLTERSEGSKEAMEEVIGKFWAAGQEGQAAPIRWASSPVNGSSLQSFFEGVATSEDEPGPLKRACELYFELDKMTSPFKSSDSDAQQPEPAAVGAAGRLRASIAPAATAWIGSLMQTMSVEE